MGKWLSLCALALLCVLGGCHHGHCAEGNTRIVASTFPVWLFTANVIRDVPGVQLELLVPAAAGCPHDFALKPADLRKLAQANIIVINGSGLEDFLDEPLKELSAQIPVINASEGASFLTDQASALANPHIFASPRLAAHMVEQIATGMAKFDSAHGARYTANGAAYADDLQALSRRFGAVGAGAVNPAIALEHDALAYIAQDAHLIIALMLEHGTSASQMAQLKQRLLAAPPALLAGDAQFSDRLLSTLAAETGLPYATLDPCASGPPDAPLGYYQTVMESNLRTLEHYFDR